MTEESREKNYPVSRQCPMTSKRNDRHVFQHHSGIPTEEHNLKNAVSGRRSHQELESKV